jgi:hypothetical protein
MTPGGDGKMNGTGAEPLSKVESLNQGVRAYCVIVFVTTFCLVFAIAAYFSMKTHGASTMVISSDAFAAVMGGVIAWWFKSRDDEKKGLVPPDTSTTTTVVSKSTEPGGATKEKP